MCESWSFATWLYEEGYTRRPLFDRLELPKLPKPHVEVLTPEEIQKIIASINPDTVAKWKSVRNRLAQLGLPSFHLSEPSFPWHRPPGQV
jgi:site-specific recombinase XerD